jgi:hypothetical protein
MDGAGAVVVPEMVIQSFATAVGVPLRVQVGGR